MKRKRTAWRIILVIVAVLAVLAIMPFALMRAGCPATRMPPPLQTVPDSFSGSWKRPEESTYLTYPEWSIVYSAEEEAVALERGRPGAYPYGRSVAQFWCGYRHVIDVTKDRYPFNAGDHLMLGVIGVSFSVEQAAKGLYEHTIGGFVGLIDSTGTPEDRYAADVAEEYGRFLHTVPWYDFPFGQKLIGLWRDVPLVGWHPLRKAERRIYLSALYGTKGIYGWLLGRATHAAYAAEDLDIMAKVRGWTRKVLETDSRIRVVSREGDVATIILPRYEAFSEIAVQLIWHGVRFESIAGNDEILVTAYAPGDWVYTGKDATLLFSRPVLMSPHVKQVALSVPVRSLDTVIPALEKSGAISQHLYDY